MLKRIMGKNRIFKNMGQLQRCDLSIMGISEGEQKEKETEEIFEVRIVIKDKEGPYIMIAGSILLEDITVFNVYASNSSVQVCEAKNERPARRNS